MQKLDRAAKEQRPYHGNGKDGGTSQDQTPTGGGGGFQAGSRNAQIVELRWEGQLLREIAERVALTKERVRQILAKAKASGIDVKPTRIKVTRQAALFLGMSQDIRSTSFRRIMAKFGISPAVAKSGRRYWEVASLSKIQPSKCIVCQSPVPLSRYTRSLTCSHACSVRFRASKRNRGNGGSARDTKNPSVTRT